jgi:hypothetical protein
MSNRSDSFMARAQNTGVHTKGRPFPEAPGGNTDAITINQGATGGKTKAFPDGAGGGGKAFNSDQPKKKGWRPR